MASIIWTTHARERNSQRLISEDWITKTLNDPDESIQSSDQTIKHKKRFDHQTVTVITKFTDKGDSLILSSWINPPIPGSSDFKNQQRSNEMKKASNLKKIWLTVLHQIGL